MAETRQTNSKLARALLAVFACMMAAVMALAPRAAQADEVLIPDPSRKGVQVIETIRKVADELVMYERCGVIVNRLTDPALLERVQLPKEDLLCVIGVDDAHTMNDIEGKTVFDLPEDSPILRGAAQALTRLNLL